jgi:hypothetical protein
MSYQSFRGKNTSTNILNEDEQGSAPKGGSYKTPLTAQGKTRVVPDKAAAPISSTYTAASEANRAENKAVSAKAAAAPKKVAVSRPSGETAASRASRQAAYDDWKKNTAEPASKLAKPEYKGFKKGGSIDGCATSGKTRGKIR